MTTAYFKTGRIIASLLALFVATGTVIIASVGPVHALSCADVVFVGVRESGAPYSGHGGMGETVDALAGAVRNALGTGRSFETYGLEYPALSTSYLGFDIATGSTTYLNSVADGVSQLENYVNNNLAVCNSWIVLAGYSQGALVIREAITAFSADALSKIGGVVLFGDPGRHGTGDGLSHLGGASSRHNGVYESALGVRVLNAPATTGVRESWCFDRDAICDYTNANLVYNLVRSKLGKHAAPHAKYLVSSAPGTAGKDVARGLLALPTHPHATITCLDGSVHNLPYTCPAPPPATITCLDGSVHNLPYTCPAPPPTTSWDEIAWGPAGSTVPVFSGGPGVNTDGSSGPAAGVPVGSHITTDCRAYNQAIAPSNGGGWWYHISAGTYPGYWTPASDYENGSGPYPATGAVWDPAVIVC